MSDVDTIRDAVIDAKAAMADARNRRDVVDGVQAVDTLVRLIAARDAEIERLTVCERTMTHYFEDASQRAERAEERADSLERIIREAPNPGTMNTPGYIGWRKHALASLDTGSADRSQPDEQFAGWDGTVRSSIGHGASSPQTMEALARMRKRLQDNSKSSQTIGIPQPEPTEEGTA